MGIFPDWIGISTQSTLITLNKPVYLNQISYQLPIKMVCNLEYEKKINDILNISNILNVIFQKIISNNISIINLLNVAYSNTYTLNKKTQSIKSISYIDNVADKQVQNINNIIYF